MKDMEEMRRYLCRFCYDIYRSYQNNLLKALLKEKPSRAKHQKEELFFSSLSNLSGQDSLFFKGISGDKYRPENLK